MCAEIATEARLAYRSTLSTAAELAAGRSEAGRLRVHVGGQSSGMLSLRLEAGRAWESEPGGHPIDAVPPPRTSFSLSQTRFAWLRDAHRATSKARQTEAAALARLSGADKVALPVGCSATEHTGQPFLLELFRLLIRYDALTRSGAGYQVSLPSSHDSRPSDALSVRYAASGCSSLGPVPNPHSRRRRGLVVVRAGVSPRCSNTRCVARPFSAGGDTRRRTAHAQGWAQRFGSESLKSDETGRLPLPKEGHASAPPRLFCKAGKQL